MSPLEPLNLRRGGGSLVTNAVSHYLPVRLERQDVLSPTHQIIWIANLSRRVTRYQNRIRYVKYIIPGKSDCTDCNAIATLPHGQPNRPPA